MTGMPGYDWYILQHRPGDSVAAAEVFDHPGIREHYAFLERLRAAGLLVAAGPLADGRGEGMTVIAAPSYDEARRLATMDDLSVANGVLEVVVRPWHVLMFHPPAGAGAAPDADDAPDAGDDADSRRDA